MNTNASGSAMPSLHWWCAMRDRLRDLEAPPVPIAVLAAQAQLSTGYFIRRFAATFGATPHDCRTAARLEQAKRWLARDERSVTDICLDLGFSSLGSFSDLFARRVGSSPSAYRRRVSVLVDLPSSRPESLAPGCLSLMCGAFRAMGTR